jgi:TRAP-type C4-dicarboxylate transport system substrate-binding protein
MTDSSFSHHLNYDIRLGAFEQVFRIDNVRVLVAIQKDQVNLFTPIYEKNFNQKPLASWFEGGMELISKIPIETMEDLKGISVGTYNQLIADAFSIMGAIPVPMDWTYAKFALNKGLVDAVCTPTIHMINDRLTDIARYVTSGLIMTAAQNCFSINLDAWKNMPRDIQSILLEEAQNSADRTNNLFIKRVNSDKEILPRMGATVILLDKSERAKMEKVCQPIVSQYINSLGNFGRQVDKLLVKRINDIN